MSATVFFSRNICGYFQKILLFEAVYTANKYRGGDLGKGKGKRERERKLREPDGLASQAGRQANGTAARPGRQPQ